MPSPNANLSKPPLKKVIKTYLAAIGRIGGHVTSDAKRKAARQNGKSRFKHMKQATLLLAFTGVSASVVDWSLPQRRTIEWTDQNSPAEVSFNVYTSSVVNLPLAQWGLMTNLIASNFLVNASITNTYRFQFDQVPQLQFFAIRTYSLFYKQESDFSNVTNTPAAPRSSRTLLIQ